MKLLQIEIPETRRLEREYILDVLLYEFLGIPYNIEVKDRQGVQITRTGERESGYLLLSDVFFPLANDAWLQTSTLPQLPLERWSLPESLRNSACGVSSIPILFGARGKNIDWLHKTEHGIELGLDILGSAFFMLTRYEEIVNSNRDLHDRFPADASIAKTEQFLLQPIVNIYLEILWACLKSLWPGLPRRHREYEIRVSHDVDFPLEGAFQPSTRVLRALAGDIIRRNNLHLALRRAGAHIFRNPNLDPANTFDWLMDVSESFRLQSSFYFICGASNKDINRYDLDQPWITNLMKRIHDRGHLIGLHPSYDSYRSPKTIKTEFERLQQKCNELGITQARWGGRQHYLQWQAPETWHHWANAGLDYDSSVGYADHVGFRAGVCYPYPVYDVRHSQRLNLTEHPLVVMEGSLLDASYMGADHSSALQYIHELATQCARYKGEFTLLWHNSSLLDLRDRNTYLSSLRTATSAGQSSGQSGSPE